MWYTLFRIETSEQGLSYLRLAVEGKPMTIQSALKLDTGQMKVLLEMEEKRGKGTVKWLRRVFGELTAKIDILIFYEHGRARKELPKLPERWPLLDAQDEPVPVVEVPILVTVGDEQDFARWRERLGANISVPPFPVDARGVPTQMYTRWQAPGQDQLTDGNGNVWYDSGV